MLVGRVSTFSNQPATAASSHWGTPVCWWGGQYLQQQPAVIGVHRYGGGEGEYLQQQQPAVIGVHQYGGGEGEYLQQQPAVTGVHQHAGRWGEGRVSTFGNQPAVIGIHQYAGGEGSTFSNSQQSLGYTGMVLGRVVPSTAAASSHCGGVEMW